MNEQRHLRRLVVLAAQKDSFRRAPRVRTTTSPLRVSGGLNLFCRGILPAIWEMQGDFRKMQGGARRNLAKSHQNSIAWMAFPYSSKQGGAGRAIFA